jgi:hypothetical protein
MFLPPQQKDVQREERKGDRMIGGKWYPGQPRVLVREYKKKTTKKCPMCSGSGLRLDRKTLEERKCAVCDGKGEVKK